MPIAAIGLDRVQPDVSARLSAACANQAYSDEQQWDAESA